MATMIDPSPIKKGRNPKNWDSGLVVPVPNLHDQTEVTTSGSPLSTFSNQLSTAGPDLVVPVPKLKCLLPSAFRSPDAKWSLTMISPFVLPSR